MESNQIIEMSSMQSIKTQPKHEIKVESLNQHQNDQFMHCKNCDFMTFTQEQLLVHNCNAKDEKFSCTGCSNTFSSKDSLKVHLKFDHRVIEDEIDKFLTLSEKQSAEDNFLKKADSENSSSKSKSKIFIKDVTLLRKPDLPTSHINLPNIFDSLDLTTTDDDIFDDFLGSTEDPDNFDFDFEEPTINNEQDDEIIAIADNQTTPSAKIYVRKNLCSETNESQTFVENNELKNQSFDQTSKIYVRSHESLTSQVLTNGSIPQPAESSTPDCVIVSSEIVEEVPASQNKIFIRNIETLTNPQTQDTNQFYDASVANTSTNFLGHSNTNYANAFTPSIYVRSYDSLVSDNHPQIAAESSQQRCKISIKNMDTLIEPSHLMHPPGIFGNAQNLVIHMRPNQTAEESLINFRDASMTPDTLPGSSNVSTCGGTDNDVIILDELNENSFTNYAGATEAQQLDVEPMICDNTSTPAEEKEADKVVNVIETNVENPERNQTPNDKPKIDIPIHENADNTEDQPMTRIPINMTAEEEPPNDVETKKPKVKKKMKIIKIIRVKKKKSSSPETDPLDTVQVIFKCNVGDCSLNFSNAKLLSYHKRCHLNENQIVCPECSSEEFKNYNTLHTHLWRHHGIDMDLFACKLCNFKTPILSRLKNFHEKIHSDEKNYKCEFANCNKRFCNSKQLKNHSQIHKAVKSKNKSAQLTTSTDNDAKKIKCQICNKGFGSESGLYIHFMEHKNDEKRFICKEKSCQYSTNDHNSFRRHNFQHSKSHQYSCPACNYTSIQSNTYRKHLEKQHKELAQSLLFKCGSCKFITISKSKYEGHVSKHLVDT